MCFTCPQRDTPFPTPSRVRHRSAMTASRPVRKPTQAQWVHSLTITCLCRCVRRSPRKVRRALNSHQRTDAHKRATTHRCRHKLASMPRHTRHITRLGSSWVLTVSQTFSGGYRPRRSRRCARSSPVRPKYHRALTCPLIVCTRVLCAEDPAMLCAPRSRALPHARAPSALRTLATRPLAVCASRSASRPTAARRPLAPWPSRP